VEALAAKGHTPGLVVILVGEDPASAGLCAQQGQWLREGHRHAFQDRYDADVDQPVVLDRRAERRPGMHGILVQLPLPKHFDEEKVLEAIDREGRRRLPRRERRPPVAGRESAFIPCTPYGVMKMLESAGVPLPAPRPW
jgi:methylenetetrahydrofolate dehydrogenase (NADP+)/methenyltetrahydrofolate cyclohydrolase